jgi:glycosyltransferase involved in cell wall biosynthesis
VTASTLNVAIVADLLEEGWPSMDLMAEMLMDQLGTPGVPAIEPTLLRPRFAARASRLIPRRNGATPFTIDRIVHRYWDYPRWLHKRRDSSDVYHIVDHSYGHLASALPAGHTIVTCHDIDAFRPLIEDGASESTLPRLFVRRLQRGLQAAAHVVCVSETTRAELLKYGLVPAARLSVVENGVHPSCTASPDAAADTRLRELLGAQRGPELLHVGSTIPRKRIDTLLALFAQVARLKAGATLIRVGGPFTGEQQTCLHGLGIAERVRVLPFIDRPTLAALYRRSTLVLLPSEREGFGLPLVESLACGTPVLASDLAVFREVGDNAVAYAPVGDVDAWTAAVLTLLDERDARDGRWQARRDAGLTRAARFTWQRNAQQMRELYEHVVRRRAS